MPELPEVETIRRGLHERILHAKIVELDVLTPKTAQFSENEKQEHIIGTQVVDVRRRAKVLIWDLSSGFSLLFHLKMTGQLIIDQPSGERFAGGHPTNSMDRATHLPDRSTRLVFQFESGDVVFFNDQRKFGWVKLLPTADIGQDSLLARVGPEPHSLDFNVDHFWPIVQKRNTSIKAVLLDQSGVAGIGNIYADEALHLAKIHPATKASDLKKDDVERLIAAIVAIISASIERGGTSFTNYVNVLGTRGDYLEHARVFKRQGLPCVECGSTIYKTRVAGRGTHVCPNCQPAPDGFIVKP